MSIADDGVNGVDGNPADNTDTDTDSLNAAPDYGITKDDGISSAQPGDSITYTIVVSNNGDQDGTGVTVSDTFPANVLENVVADNGGVVDAVNGTISWSLGDLAAGASVTLTVTADVIDPAEAGVDDFTNSASVGDDGNNGSDATPGDNAVSDTDTLVAAPDLQITKDDGGASTVPGGTVVYTIGYTNVGSQHATGVVLTETLPSNATFSAANSDAGWSETAPGSGIYEFVIGDLDVGAVGSADFAVTVDSTVPYLFVELNNAASISDDGANGADENSADNTATDDTPVTVTVDLAITKDDGQVTVLAGDTVVYTINYENLGNVDARGVVITETLPPGSTFDAASSTAGWTETAPGSGVFEFNVGNLAASATGNVDFAVTVDDPLAAGIDALTNNVSIVDDGANGADASAVNDSDTDVDAITAAPDLYVNKDNGLSVTDTGDTVVYSIEYGNTGTQDATGVIITETLPPGSIFSAASSTAGWTETAPGSGVYEFNVGNLAAGSVGNTVTFAVTVNDPLAAGIDDLVNNVAIADDGTNGADEDPSDNTFSESDPIDAAPDYTITKDDGITTASPDDTITYTIVVSNVGDQDGTGIVVSDTFPAGLLVNVSADNGGVVDEVNGTIMWNLGNLNAGDSVTLTVTADVASFVDAGIDDFTNFVAVTDDTTNGPDPNPGDNTDGDTDILDAVPDLGISKTDGGASSFAGGTIVYTLNYENFGPQGATGVTLEELLPNNTTFNAASSDPGWTEVSPNTWHYVVGALPAGQSGSALFAVTVDASPPDGTSQITNNAIIFDDASNGMDAVPPNNFTTDTTPLVVGGAPDLSVSKSDGTFSVTPGEAISYVISYQNIGNADATGIVVTETLPANTTYDAANSDPGWTETSPGSGVYEFSVSAVAQGGSGSVTFAVILDTALPSGYNTISNTVTITDDGSNGADLNPSNNTGTDTDVINAAPDLTVSKDDGGVTSVPGWFGFVRDQLPEHR